MSILDQLKQVMNEADEGSSMERDVHADSSTLKFNGKMSYSGNSAIKLDLTIEMPAITKVYTSKQTFDSISEDQFRKASDKIQNALEDLTKEFNLSLKNKLASYGLNEGEQNDGRI